MGDPEPGKSSLLQYLALEWTELSPKELPLHPIPLPIELRAYVINRKSGQYSDFLEFFNKGSGIVCRLPQHELHEKLKAGEALVLFDGLDEVFDATQRQEIITDIHRFTNDYPKVRVIVTSRIIGYKPGQLQNAQFRHFMLQDLNAEQIEDFLQRWHDLTYNDESEKVRKRERLKTAIAQSKAIQELAGNPLQLTMMAILNRNQELPRDRTELYNQASRVLLHQWDVERALIEDERLDPKIIQSREKQEMLRQVAYQMQATEKGLAGNLIAADELEKILTNYLQTLVGSQARILARLMIGQLRTRNFILCDMGGDYYAFVHRTFLEYFCATSFVERFEKKRELSLEELKTEVFGKHWQDESWHEVLRLIVGAIDPKFAGEIIEYLMEQNGEGEKFANLFLAAECLEEVRTRSAVAATDKKLLHTLKWLTKYGHYFALEVCGYGHYQFYNISHRAITVVATTWKDRPDTLPWLKQLATDDNPKLRVQGAAVSALAEGWKDDPDTLPLLKQLATDNVDSSRRYAAVSALARGWKDDPDTLPLLKQLATDNANSDVRRAAVFALAEGWKDDPDTLPLLKQRATDDANWAVRGAAVSAITQGWKDDPDTLPWLKQRATDDADDDVRGAAVEAIAQGWKDDPDTLPLLKQRATDDANSDVRRAAVVTLAQGWKDEPWMFEFLRDRALNDPFEGQKYHNKDFGEIVLKEIIKFYPNHPETLPLFRDRAQNDPDEQVREFASAVLEKWDKT